MKDFSTLGLSQQLANSLARMQFTTPTPIQAKAIPVALKGRDILGSAQTGTGKTGAFGIPLIERLLTTDKTTALIMTPTRELATQVLKSLQEMLGHGSGIKTALLIGGDSMYRQLNQLKARPRLIVGTPGRINDHLERRSLNLRDAGFLVLDETDRMLDMGFGVQIDRILKHMPKERQTLLFSATLPPYIIEIAKKYLHMPERIAVGDVHSPIENIKQEMVKLATAEKYKALIEHLSRRDGSVIVFVKTKHGADRMATKLQRDGHKAEAIHGDLKQSKRDRVIADFRDKEYRILVATDVAARGLDIPHIEHVINYDLPQVAEDYIHRIGRTARAGKKGEAVVFVAPEDGAKWKAIYHLMNPSDKSIKNSDRADENLVKRKKPAGKKSFGAGRKDSFGEGFSKSRFKKDGDRKPAFGKRDRDEGDFKRERSDRGDFKKEGFKKGGFKSRRDEYDGNASFAHADRFDREDRRERGEGQDSYQRRPRRDEDSRGGYRGERSERPARSADRPARSGDRPQRSERSGDRPQRSGDRPQRSGDRFERRERSEGAERYERRERPARFDRADGEGRKRDDSEGRKSFGKGGDKPFRAGKKFAGEKRDFGGDRPARAGKKFASKSATSKGASADRPRSRPAGAAPKKARRA